MNNALLYVGGLLVVILAALFAGPYFVDWNGYRGVFEEEASKVLGRDVRVGGAVNLRLLPTPYVRFEKVRLADTSGQTGEPFIRADSFTMWLSGPPLLRGVLEANQVELNKPVLSLVLDGQGGGNWSNLKIKSGSLPFVPQDVALRSVKLQDGVIALYDAQSQALGRIEAVNGELSADALAGPYKFKGLAKWGGEDREIKFATTPPESNGAFNFKANIRSTKSITNYAIDARLEDFSTKPKLTGELTAKLPMPEVGPIDPKAAQADPATTEVRSHISADALGAKFDDINIALESAAEPQIITGSAEAKFAGTPRLDMVLAAKWLDLDKLVGAGEGGAPLPKIKNLGLGLLQSLAGDGAAGIKIDIEQIKIGGETAGGLKFDAERQSGAVHLKELRAGLPGGSRLELSGEMKDDKGLMNFDGSILIHGANLGRLLAWAAKSGSPIDVKSDGPFSAEGRLISTDKQFGFTDAKAEIAGQLLTGEFRVIDNGRQHTEITVEGARLDTAQLFPEKAREIEQDIRRALGLSEPKNSDEIKTASASAAQGESDVKLRVLAGELKNGARIFHNVDATLVFEGGEFRVPNSKFNTESGLGVTFEARVKNAANEPNGTLAYEFDAQTPAAMKDAAILTGLSEFLPVERFAALGSARVAGLVRLGERGKGFADVSFGGDVKGAQVSGQAQLDGGIANWRTVPSRIAANIKATSLDPILLALGTELPASAAYKARPAGVTIASSGIFASDATALAEIKAEGLDGMFSGHVVWPEKSPLDFDGTVKLKAKDLGEVLGFAGMSALGGTAGTPAEGAFDVKAASGSYELSTRRIALGQSNISGHASFNRKAGQTTVLTADIIADRLKVSSLISALLDRAGTPAHVADADGESQRQAIWSEAPFNLDGFKALQGTVNLKFGVLELDDGLTARDGDMKIALAPNKISVTELNAHAAGGKLQASSDFEKASGGVALTARVKLDGAELASLSSTAKGRASIDFSGSARGASPAALISVLSGKGGLTLDGASHSGPAAVQIAQTSDAVLSGKLPNDAGAISETILATLATSEAVPGTRPVSLVLGDGALKLDPYVIDSKDGRATVTTTVDLASLNLDSVWQIAALVPPQQPPPGAGPEWGAAVTVKGPLPSVPVVYVGRLGDLKHLAVKVETNELQRELTVRQVERNVEELERQRRKEDERVRLEQERRKAIEAERAAAKAQAAAQKAAAAAGQGQPPSAQQQPGELPMPPILPESNGANAATTNDGQQGTPPLQNGQFKTEAGAPDQGPDSGKAGTALPPAAVESSRAVPIEVTPDAAAGQPQIRPPAAARPAAVGAPKPPAGRSQRSPRNASEEMTRALGGAP